MNPLERIVRQAGEKGEFLDLHLHTDFSVDVHGGNSFLEFMTCGKDHDVIPGFLDHLQTEKLNWDNYVFNHENIHRYFEAYDEAKSSGLPSFFGLEVDFYDPNDHEDWNDDTREWLDMYREEFDYFIGTIHDVKNFTITIPFELEDLLEEMDFDIAAKLYFETLDAGIQSGMFEGFAHLDVVYRFCGPAGILPAKERYFNDGRTRSAMELCIDNGIIPELNLRGFDHPWNTTYPSEILLEEMLERIPGAMFFTGSDSHNVGTFLRFIPVVKKYSKILRELSG
ncbi:MAG: hypothetical protein ACTSU9_12575 [Promethearchaeota archaeon]